MIRKKIADFFQRTSMSSYCTAFAYRPLPQVRYSLIFSLQTALSSVANIVVCAEFVCMQIFIYNSVLTCWQNIVNSSAPPNGTKTAVKKVSDVDVCMFGAKL